MPIATYDEALAFWFDRVNYEQRGMPDDLRELKLDRMWALLDRLGHPERDLPIVHIAGSKGKGSTAAMLSSVLRQAGLRTGLFTSPHLCRVEERIQIDGEPINSQQLTVLMRMLEPHVLALETAGTPPTFFEIVTALGLLHFAGQRGRESFSPHDTTRAYAARPDSGEKDSRPPVDIAVLEVGLGGRFDSTNICTPRVAVITSISFDHTQQLGTTLAAIAREKAGIIKPGRPTISGVTVPEARAVIAETAERCRSPLYVLGRDFHYQYTPGRVTPEATRLPRISDVVLGLLGEHQAANAALVIACVQELRRQGWAIPQDAVREGLRHVEWPARMEVVRRRPMVILDCAHNVASMQAVIDTLQASFPPSRRGLILACSRDKDLAGIVSVLRPHFSHAYLTRYTASTRAAEPGELAALWRAAGGDCDTCPTPAAAWEAAQRWAQPEDLLCITGSVFLAGELRPLLQVPQSASRQT